MRLAHPDFVMPGHVMRIDPDGYTSFVPDRKAAMPWSGKGKAQTAYRSKETVQEIFPTEPIKKRTPQQRVDSMQKHMQEDAMKGFPGLPEEKVQEVVRRSWQRGEPVAAEDVRAFATALMQEAENKFEAAESKKVVRTAPSD